MYTHVSPLFHLHTCISVKHNHTALLFLVLVHLKSFRLLTYPTPPLQTVSPPAERDVFSYFDHLFWLYSLFINYVFLGCGSVQSVSFCQGGVQNEVQFSRSRELKGTSLYNAQTKITFIFIWLEQVSYYKHFHSLSLTFLGKHLRVYWLRYWWIFIYIFWNGRRPILCLSF